MLVDRLNKGEEVSVSSATVPELSVLRVLVYDSSVRCLLPANISSLIGLQKDF